MGQGITDVKISYYLTRKNSILSFMVVTFSRADDPLALESVVDTGEV